MPQNCKECGDPFKGRSDKKFCSDACRNSYNNKFNKDATNLMRSINRILRKNRSILAKLNPSGKTTVNLETLRQKDFNFKYITNTYTTKNGKVYYFCYEHGFLPLGNDLFALVVKEKYVDS